MKNTLFFCQIFVLQRENNERIIAAVNKLPEVMMETARLYIANKLPPDTIAPISNCPAGNNHIENSQNKKISAGFSAGT